MNLSYETKEEISFDISTEDENESISCHRVTNATYQVLHKKV